MKLTRFLTFFAILILSKVVCAQTQLNEPKLLDEFGTGCSEIMKARLDNFASAVKYTPNSIGVVILTGKEDEEGKNRNYLEWIKQYLFVIHEIDKQRVVFHRKPNSSKRHFEMWLYPKSKLPKLEKPFSYTATKTTLFDSAPVNAPDSSYDHIGDESEIYPGGFYKIGCNFKPNDSEFAKELLSNKRNYGQLVIFSNSSKDFEKVKEYALRRLVNRFNVPRNRIEVKPSGKPGYPRIEFWILPQPTEPQSPIFTDEATNIPCGDFLARTDGFLQSIQERPFSVGLVIIYGNEKRPASALSYERIIEGEILLHKFDRKRIRVVRAKSEMQARIRFWVIPLGAPDPPIEKENYLERIASSKKAFVLFTEGGEGYCPYASPTKLLIETLALNPTAKTNIVIKAESKSLFQKKKTEIQSLLTDLPKNRARFFFVKTDTNPIGDYTDNYAYVEYWFVPKRR